MLFDVFITLSTLVNFNNNKIKRTNVSVLYTFTLNSLSLCIFKYEKIQSLN